MKISKEYVDRLDNVLEFVLKTNTGVAFWGLHDINEYPNHLKTDEELKDYFSIFISYYDFYDCAECTYSNDLRSCNEIKPNKNTKSFLLNGGFEKLYQTQNKEERKIIFDSKLSKFRYYMFFPMLFLSLIGGMYSSIKIIQILSKEEKPGKALLKTEVQQSEKHTLFYDRKNLDSLHNSKTQVDSLKN